MASPTRRPEDQPLRKICRARLKKRLASSQKRIESGELVGTGREVKERIPRAEEPGEWRPDVRGDAVKQETGGLAPVLDAHIGRHDGI